MDDAYEYEYEYFRFAGLLLTFIALFEWYLEFTTGLDEGLHLDFAAGWLCFMAARRLVYN